MRRVYDPAMPVVTISASYGSGGSEVAPALAERLGVRFVDRVAHRDRPSPRPGRERGAVLAADPQHLAPAGGLTAGSIHAERELHDRFSDREALEAALRDAAAVGDVVILGRAGALALRDHPSALHVRLDGPSEARVFRTAPAPRPTALHAVPGVRRLHAVARLVGDAMDAAGVGASVYEDVNDPRGLGRAHVQPGPEFFLDTVRPLLNGRPFDALEPKPEHTMLGRTYAIGYEPDLSDAAASASTDGAEPRVAMGRLVSAAAERAFAQLPPRSSA